MEIKFQPVEYYTYVNKEDFQAYISLNRKPLILKDFDIGPCREKWSIEYLVDNVGKMDVRVHLSPTGRMNFLNKNFMYKSMPLGEFLFRSSGEGKNAESQLKPILCESEVLYLRTIGFDRRGKEVANFKQDFPQIAGDISFPDLFDEERFFSSVLRVASAGVQIWTHYDVMDNALIQISGTKRVVLFSPDDAPNMYLRGDKSEVIDIDNPDINTYPNFFNAVRHECELQPGDILFIPALWFHNILCNTFSIGVNVFWRHLKPEMYDKHDAYGNKDVMAASRALEHINKAVNLVKSLPQDHKRFYLNRCISELQRAIDDMKENENATE